MILDRILEHKKAELRHKQSRSYLADLKAAIRDAPPALGFAVTLDATTISHQPGLDRGSQESVAEPGAAYGKNFRSSSTIWACAHVPGAWGSGRCPS